MTQRRLHKIILTATLVIFFFAVFTAVSYAGTIPYGTFDWRNESGQNWMTSVKNQNDPQLGCDSCWAFATLGVIEAVINIEANDPDIDMNLSEQHLISCCWYCGDCGGGNPPLALLYIEDNGVPDESCFPYQAANSDCASSCAGWENRAWTIGNRPLAGVSPNTTEAYQEALETYGPLIVQYSSAPKHVVVLVGYNDTHWIFKNSKGADWEEEGYGTVLHGHFEEYNFAFWVDNTSGPLSSVHNLNTSEDFYTIQAAIDDSDTSDSHIIEVEDGTYNENVDVNKRLTIRSENGSASTIVNAEDSNDHVFEVTANYVNISGFTVKDATGSGSAGIYLGSGVNHCNISNNKASNNYNGIYLSSSSNNNITCNWVHNNTQAGFYLTVGSTGNNISLNNIMSNGDYNETSEGWEWNFHNEQSDNVEAENNYWGAGMTNETIEASIKGDPGSVDYYPYEEGPVPCAPIPELPTIILLSVGLLVLAGYGWLRRKKTT